MTTERRREIAYLDSSALLRVILGETGAISLADLPPCYSSRLIRTECIRVFQRLYLTKKLTERAHAQVFEQLETALTALNIVNVTEQIFNEAERPFPTILGTLDAIHLGTSMLLRAELQADILFLTHDTRLGKAAEISGFRVIGIDR